MDSDESPSTSPIKDGQLNRNIANIINFLDSPEKPDYYDSGTETSDCGEPRLDILKDVVAYAEVKSNEDNRSGMIGRELYRLGARVEKRFTKHVTHVVFYNGNEKTRQKAEKNGLFVVSVTWVQMCKQQGRRVPEKDYPAAKITPKMIGAKRKKYRSMQPITLEEELARSKERAKRKLNREHRWKILIEAEAYADYSPSYVTKLKSGAPLVPETPADRTGTACKPVFTGLMSTLTEEEETVSSVEESPVPSPALYKRLFDSDDSGDERPPPLWERVKRFTPSRTTDCDSDTGSDVNLPRVGNSPETSPIKTPARQVVLPLPESSEMSARKRRSLGRKALLNSAKKALMQQRNPDGLDLTPQSSQSQEDMFVEEKKSKNVPETGSLKKVGKRRSLATAKLPSVDETSELVTKKRNLLRPGDDMYLSPVQSSSESENKNSPSVEDLLKTKPKSRRRSMAVASPSLEMEKPKTRRRSTLSEQIVANIVAKGIEPTKKKSPEKKLTSKKSIESKSKKSPENQDGKLPEKKRKRPQSSSSDSDTAAIIAKKQPPKKRKSLALPKKVDETSRTDPKTSEKVTSNTELDDKSPTKKETKRIAPKEQKTKRLSRKKKESTSHSSVSEEEKSDKKSVNRSKREVTLPGITLTNLHRDERGTVTSIVKRLGGFRLTERVDETTTHVVCGETRRTLNVMHALLRGCWLVGKEWVFESLEHNKWIGEEPYTLVDAFPTCKTSQAQEEPRTDVFSACGPILLDSKTLPPPDELRSLVQLGDGEVVSTPKRARISVGKWRSSLTCVTEQWLLDSITSLECQPTEPYLLKPEK